MTVDYPQAADQAYFELVRRIDDAIRADKTLETFRRVLETLTDDEKAVLANYHHPPVALGRDQERAFRDAFTQGVLDSRDHLNWNAVRCARVCTRLEQDFVKITGKLADAVNKHPRVGAGDLESDFSQLASRYRELLDSSRRLAVRVATNARQFDSIVIPIVGDSNLSVERRREAIQEFIDKAEGLELQATQIKESFDRFLSDMTAFVGRFGSWANTVEAEIADEIQTLSDEIEKLKQKVKGLTSGLIGVGVGGTTAALGILVTASLCAGPAAPFIWGFGIAVGLGSVGAIIGQTIALSIYTNDISRKEREKGNLVKERENLQKTRSELVTLGTELREDVSNTIGIINQAWRYCQNDAVAIQDWLRQGATQADLPPYLTLALGRADGICECFSSMTWASPLLIVGFF